ncbi:MAG: pyridoxamine 5'-phosphate oxidase family protein [Acidobacteria bacterium]|nr:pyridoxamine 5'-phosphate oxidase family protein [Acidobacteriota bacterium]
MSEYPVSERNRLRRLPKRAAYDRATIHAILDAAFLCHVGFNLEGTPVVVPTAYARDDDSLILHGSAASRMLRQLSSGIEASVSVAIVDGLVLARSAFHHSINYRSVVLFGVAVLIDEPNEKLAALETFMEHVTPGRWMESRMPSSRELARTSVLRLMIGEASAKIRSGDPVDDPEDHSLEVWAGVVPLKQHSEMPVAASDLRQELDLSEAVSRTGLKWSS